MEHPNLYLRCSIRKANEKCKLNRLGWQDYVHLSSNHTKLVRQGDNSNKKTLMYIPYDSYNYRLNTHNPYKLNKLGKQNFIYSTFNHMKLVRWGDNPNKKTLINIPYVSCSYKLNIHNPCYPRMSNTNKHTQKMCSDNIQGNCASPEGLISPASNHTKLVHRWDNPK